MRFPAFTLRFHLVLLMLFALFVAGIILLPVLLIGFPYVLPEVVRQTGEFVETGINPNLKMRLLVPLLSLLHPLLRDNMTAWTAVGTFSFAAALVPWWLLVRRLFDTQIAWISTVIFAALPLYWREALELSGYAQALFFLFTGSLLFLVLRDRRPLPAVFLSGLCMGCMVASRDAFLPFLPWFVAVYVWHARKTPVHALVAALLFTITVYSAYSLWRLPNVIRQYPTMDERIVGIVSPPEFDPGEEHLYPDEYTYKHLREEFDALARQRAQDLPFLERQQDAYLRIIFGLEEPGFFGSLGNSLWLFLNAQSSLFYDEMTGGVFLWLFIVPGMAILWYSRRFLLLLLVGLYLAMEFQIRVFLHFGRTHLNDTGWILALFAAVGVAGLATVIQRQHRRLRWGAIAAFLVAVIAAQLLQANRRLLAQLYNRSSVPMVYAAAEAARDLPAEAVVAHPRQYALMYFVPQKNISLHTPTIDYLSEKGRLREPFELYGITHILGYDPEHEELIRGAVPGIQIVRLPNEPPPVPLTPNIKYLLNLLR